MHLKIIKTSIALHCLAWQNISTQHYVIKFNYIFYLQQLHSYPAYMIQNIFKFFFWWQLLCFSKATFRHYKLSTFTFKTAVK